MNIGISTQFSPIPLRVLEVLQVASQGKCEVFRAFQGFAHRGLFELDFQFSILS